MGELEAWEAAILLIISTTLQDLNTRKNGIMYSWQVEPSSITIILLS